jgi:hypothetical protein
MTKRPGAGTPSGSGPAIDQRASGGEFTMSGQGIAVHKMSAFNGRAIEYASMSTRKQQVPVAIENARLGILRRESDRLYSDAVVTPAGVLKLAMELTEKDDDIVIERASAIVRGIVRYSASAKRYASRKLRPLKNRTWCDETTPVTDLQFRRRLTLEEIDVGPGLHVGFWYRDGDLFWGHYIQVVMDHRDRFISAELLG